MLEKVCRDINIKVNLYSYRKVPQQLRDLAAIKAKRFRRIGQLEVWECSWLKKGRGFNFSVESGKILVYQEHTYHVGKQSLKIAIRNLRRKILANTETQTRIRQVADLSGVKVSSLYSVADAVLSGDIQEFDALPISKSTSFRAGNCKPGTKEFVQANALESKKTLTIKEYRECDPLQYKSEYRAALLQAIKDGYEKGKVTIEQLQTIINRALPEVQLTTQQ